MSRMRLDLEALHDRALPSATLVNGVLTIDGTAGADHIVVRQTGTALAVRGEQIDVNGTLVDSVDVSNVTRIAVAGRGGNDLIDLRGVSVDARISGGAGNDRIFGGSGNDAIAGGAGDDVISGGPGNDSLSGGAGNDQLTGGAGNDRLDGGSGNDFLSGNSGNDTLNGGSGTDSLEGGPGNNVEN